MAKKSANSALPKKDTRYKAGAWEDAFLKAYAASGSVTLAAKAAGIDRNTVYHWKRDYPEFAARFELAKEEAIGILEGTMMQRAREKSDVLLIFALKSLKPEVYGDRVKQEHSGAITHHAPQLPDLSKLTYAELYQLRHGTPPPAEDTDA